MKTRHCLIVSALLTQSAWALFPLLDHIDLRATYRPGTQDWKWELVTADENADPAQAYFPARDAEYPDGEKDYRPSGGEWDFLGAGEGEPLWIYLESGDAYSWLGFDNTSAGLQNPVNFSLAGVTGPAGGNFSLYRVIGGEPVVFMSTADGISTADLFPKPAGHHHLNWSFTRRGMWAVDLKVSGTRTGGAATVAGATDTARLFFAIGEKAERRARNFDAATVMDESVAGDLADPDHDGWPNLLEYAFGGNPRQSGLKRSGTQISAAPVQRMVQHEGAAYPSITFYQMKDSGAAGIRYGVEWQSGLEASGWEEGGFIHLIENVDAKWERVTVRDSQPAGEGKRFCRIRVEVLEEP
ncbi:MAG: hypothetical protein EOP85_02215 [Verrucomicrobiaceae bacterium]|nr:MAG: hypothetical protein EOP85_02215 [Verrucomicrobiaceae bacterium]